MTLRLPKDLLGLVFWELDHGHDLINFSEIDQRCNDIFQQNLEVVKNIDPVGDPLIYMQHKLTKQKYGLLRHWWEGTKSTLFSENNYCHGKLHGRRREWWSNGTLFFEIHYHYGEFHGWNKKWNESGQLVYSKYFHYGIRQIEK